ncbi:MAG: EAL domain-containing protein, partial [Desulfobacteria bacterium]
PLDFLKIDQSFVRNVASSRSDQAIVRATIAMAHGLNLKVIAEGVETTEQMAFLCEQGCDEVQGFLFSRAVPPREFAELMTRAHL